MNHMVKAKVNLMADCYANKIIYIIGNGIVSNTSVAFISNVPVEVLLTKRNPHWLALIITSPINQSCLKLPKMLPLI